MSFTLARSAVESHFAANWTATPVAFENVPFAPPATGAWVKLLIVNEASETAGLGLPRLRRHRGRILVHCHVPAGAGAQEALRLADAAAALFRTAGLPGHVLLEPVADSDGEGPDGFQATLTVPFWRDELAA